MARPHRTSGMVGAKPNTSKGGLSGRMKPHELADTNARTTTPMDNAESTTPVRSKRDDREGTGRSLILPLSGKISRTIMMVSAAKTQRQLKYVVTQPPIKGPAAAAAPAIPPRSA